VGECMWGCGEGEGAGGASTDLSTALRLQRTPSLFVPPSNHALHTYSPPLQRGKRTYMGWGQHGGRDGGGGGHDAACVCVAVGMGLAEVDRETVCPTRS